MDTLARSEGSLPVHNDFLYMAARRYDVGDVYWRLYNASSCRGGLVNFFAAMQHLTLHEWLIDALAQTEDGWMWVSAHYAGLFRFDGVRFYPFVSDDGSRLSGAAISVLRPGPDGALWIGHGRGGVSVPRGGRFEHVITPEVSGGVYAISHGTDGATWVASKNGLFRIAGKRAERVGTTQGLRGPRAEYVLADAAAIRPTTSSPGCRPCRSTSPARRSSSGCRSRRSADCRGFPICLPRSSGRARSGR